MDSQEEETNRKRVNNFVSPQDPSLSTKTPRKRTKIDNKLISSSLGHDRELTKIAKKTLKNSVTTSTTPNLNNTNTRVTRNSTYTQEDDTWTAPKSNKTSKKNLIKVKLILSHQTNSTH